MLSNKNLSKFKKFDLKKLAEEVKYEVLEQEAEHLLISVATPSRGLLRKEIFELFYLLNTNPPTKEPIEYYWKESRDKDNKVTVWTFMVCPIAFDRMKLIKKGKK